MSRWTDKQGRKHVGIMVKGQRIHRVLAEGASESDAKHLEAELRRAAATASIHIPGDPSMLDVLGLYAKHTETLRGTKTALYHAARIEPWAQLYRASQARECAAHIIKDLREQYKPGTINRSLNALKKGLSIAWESGATTENYGQRIKTLVTNNQREVFLSIEEVRQIAQHCTPEMQAVIWFALLTGARRGEILQIERKHIRTEHIDIPASHTKTHKIKAVPIAPALRPWLEHFPLKIRAEGVKSAWRRAREKAGMEHVNFHDLRHSCATLMIELDIDLYTIGEILGHSNVQTTQRYAHLQLKRKAAALGKLGGLVDGIKTV
jgi:integrase